MTLGPLFYYDSKDPVETDVFTGDFTLRLSTVAGDYIVSGSPAVAIVAVPAYPGAPPESPPSLAAVSDSITLGSGSSGVANAAISVYLTSGTSGVDYYCEFSCTTNRGRTLRQTAVVPVAFPVPGGGS